MAGVRTEDRLPRLPQGPTGRAMSRDPLARTVSRCAIYTRKSTEEGLDKEANSLETQREVCSAYIRSQAHKGWVELNTAYDDGGQSGGNLSRPAMQRLLADIELSRVDVVVIYKIDRLTRSLTDFVRLIDIFERFGIAFVSITQAFDTSDSMGRLVLNVLLTFAQFERELLGDRLRDKFAALRRRGKFIGGNTPFGYDVRHGRLVVNAREADIVRDIYERYPVAISGNQLLRQLQAEGVRSKQRVTRHGKSVGGNPIGTGLLHRILTNPLYLGFIDYKGTWHSGEQDAILTRAQWDRVQAVRAERHDAQIPREPSRNLLLGMLWDEHGRRMRVDCIRPEHRRARRYYASELTRAGRRARLKLVHVQADEIEELTLSAIRAMLGDRSRLGSIVARLGTYDEDTVRMLAAGPRAARHIEAMDRPALRALFEALIARAEVSRTDLRLFMRCTEVIRLLMWDGVGQFRQAVQTTRAHAGLIEMVQVSAALVREHRHFSLPIQKRDTQAKPDGKLVAVVRKAEAARAMVMANRDRSMTELAQAYGVGPSYFARLVRLNYLAPDILTAIVDGTHPPDLTPKKLIYSSVPLDWEQQRHLLGFS